MTKVISSLSRAGMILSLAVLAVANTDARIVVRRGPTHDTRALGAFQQRLEAYAAIHRHFAASLPMLGRRGDGRPGTIAGTYLAAAISAARATARPGDIFTPEVSRFLRDVIRDTTSAGDVGLSASLVDEDGRLLPGIHPYLHTSLATWDTRELPPTTLSLLPALPRELEYRLVDYDLVLWDAEADLIVDILPFALAHPEHDALYR